MIGKGIVLQNFHGCGKATLYLDGVNYEGEFYYPHECIPTDAFGYGKPISIYETLIVWKNNNHGVVKDDEGNLCGSCTCDNGCKFEDGWKYEGSCALVRDIIRMWSDMKAYKRDTSVDRVVNVLHRIAFAAEGTSLCLDFDMEEKVRPHDVADGHFIDGVLQTVRFICDELSVQLPREGPLGYIEDPGGDYPFQMRPHLKKVLESLMVDDAEGDDENG